MPCDCGVGRLENICFPGECLGFFCRPHWTPAHAPLAPALLGCPACPRPRPHPPPSLAAPPAPTLAPAPAAAPGPARRTIHSGKLLPWVGMEVVICVLTAHLHSRMKDRLQVMGCAGQGELDVVLVCVPDSKTRVLIGFIVSAVVPAETNFYIQNIYDKYIIYIIFQHLYIFWKQQDAGTHRLHRECCCRPRNKLK